MLEAFFRLYLAAAAAAPVPQAPADTTLEQCAAATSGNDKKAGEALGKGAERHYRAVVAASPSDRAARIDLARTLSQCRTAYAGVFALEGIVNESNALLTAVLAEDSTDWSARYALALNHYHVPRFFGRTDDAVREFEHLLAQQGNRTEFAELAGTFVYLGDLYDREGRGTDAIAMWKRGAALFPADARLKRRLEKHAS